MIYNKRVDIREKLILFLIILLFFSSSFDVFLNVNIGGFILKPHLVVSVLLTFLWIFKPNSIRIKLFGGYFFIAWCFFLCAFLFNTNLTSRNILYFYSLLQFLISILVVSDIIKKEFYFKRMIKWYIRSFEFVAFFGLVQFIAGFAGLSLLTQQWWVEGSLSRINGFSYEPSYFATYLIIGWSLLLFLLKKYTNSDYEKMEIKKSSVKRAFFFLSLSIVLSSSKLGVFFIAVISIGYFIFILLRDILIRMVISKQNVRTISLFFLITVPLFIFISNNFDSYAFLLSGSGLGDAPSHSVDIREKDLENTLEVAKHSVLIGVSLGGIPSAIAEAKGRVLQTNEEAKDFEGLNIFAEVFAASSLLGFLFFMAYFSNLLFFGFKCQRDIPKCWMDLLQASAFALLVELLILMFNQNILRAYLWVHVAVLNCLIFFVKEQIQNDNG